VPILNLGVFTQPGHIAALEFLVLSVGFGSTAVLEA